jgi:beta-lactamase class A
MHFLALLLAISAPPLQTQLERMAAAYHGQVALYAQDLRSGRSVALDADRPVPTASVIKLLVLEDALEQIQAGTVRLDDRIQMTARDPVAGSGVLRLFDTPLPLTFKDVLSLMIDLSDNTATNLAIDHLGLANIDAAAVRAGLKNTWLYKKVFLPPEGPVPPDQPAFGLGKTTAREMASIIERFQTCAFRPALCETAMTMLKGQFDRDGIPRYLGGLEVANKTGALDAVRNDVGIVFAPKGPIVISIFTYDNADRRWTADNAGQLLIAHMAKAIVEAWK